MDSVQGIEVMDVGGLLLGAIFMTDKLGGVPEFGGLQAAGESKWQNARHLIVENAGYGVCVRVCRVQAVRDICDRFGAVCFCFDSSSTLWRSATPRCSETRWGRDFERISEASKLNNSSFC